MSWISRSISTRRRLAPSMRSSARAQASRALDSASSEILAARSVSAITFSAAASASAATRRPLSAASISLISARRFSANNRRRIVEFGALGRDLGDAGLDGGDLRGRALPAVLPFAPLGQDRLQAAVGQFGLARQRLRFGPHLGGEAAMAVDVGANARRAGFRCRGSAAIRPVPRWRSRARHGPRRGRH